MASLRSVATLLLRDAVIRHVRLYPILALISREFAHPLCSLG